MQPLKLFALDAEDLEVVSAHVQDAVGRVGDMAFLPGQRRFAIILNRFDWSSANDDAGQASRTTTYERRRTALHFERVISAKTKNLPRHDADRVVNLLAVRFEPASDADQAPAGIVELDFSGGATIRLDVECVEARLSDLGPTWATSHRPEHVEPADPTARDEND